MGFPKLKHALLCRILIYVVVIGCGALPVVALALIKSVPAYAVGITGFVMGILLLAYIIINAGVLMAMDIGLAVLHCNNTARTQFNLPRRRRIKRIEKRLSSFGRGYEPLTVYPIPSAVRYHLKSSITVYSKGTERVVLTYRTDLLDKEEYTAIIRSAMQNSKALIGKKKPLIIDKAQRKEKLNRVTVVAIIASRVDSELNAKLFDTVCKGDGDGYDEAFLPCVIDTENRICVFNSEREPYYGFGYPVKNRGIRIIRKRVFGGRLTLANNPHRVRPIKDMEDLNQSLWQFWRRYMKENIIENRKMKKRFQAMKDREIFCEDDFLYVKLGEKGAWIGTERDEERKIVKIDPIGNWYYPKSNKIGKEALKEIKKLTVGYFLDLGYTCDFLTFDD